MAHFVKLSGMAPAYLLIAHGSRDPQGNRAFETLIEKFRQRHPGRLVEGAYLEIAKPSIPEGIETCLRKGAKQLFVIPLMLFPGRHVKEDIPRQIEEAKMKHPQIDFHFSGPLSEDPMLLNLLSEKIELTRKRK